MKMAPRTRKRTSDPEDSSCPTPRHSKASPTRSRPARAPRINAARYRQSTLTQIVPEVSFLSRGSAVEESEDEEHAPRPVKRRRRRIGPSQKTLTQIGWINPLVVPSDDEEQEEDGEGDGEEGFESEVLPSDDDEYDEVVAGEQNENGDTEEVFYGFSDNEENHDGDKLHDANPDGVKDSPQTPRRPRPREIPSSQTPPVTPLTPLSVLRKRALYNGRSPLKVLSTNGNQDNKSRDRAKMPPPKFSTPVKRRGARVAFDTKVVKVAPTLLSERSHVSDSQDLSDEEGFGAVSPRGVAIGQETQAMIHQIDAACGLDPPGQTTPSKNRVTPEAASESPSTSQASRSFNFDEEDEAGAVPSPAPATKSPILGEDDQEGNIRAEDNQQQDIEDGNVEEDDEGDEDEEFPTSSFPTPRAPPPTQATPTHTPTQESRTSQPFALQHPSQVSTVAETTQATPPRATPRQREKPPSQKLGRTRRQTVHSSEDVISTFHGTVLPSQASTTDDPIESQTPKAQFQRQSQQQQDDRIPESPLARSNSKTNATRNPRPRSRKTRSSPSQTASSSIPRPPPALLLTSSPTSPSLSTSNRHANTENIPGTRRRLELYSSGGGGGNAGASFDGKVISATQMLPESLMNYSMPLPPAGWDASSVGWVASSMPDEEEEGDGED
ncbi:hypothetical protein IWX90DRAFT_445733 [Phyllosticta citrichinensis]|uniref:Uncharacterized protein n=1 Tax=Phyllosticta citrichinensis TaxID=1130410 RepID=A0ABR1XFL1_9PEZI